MVRSCCPLPVEAPCSQKMQQNWQMMFLYKHAVALLDRQQCEQLHHKDNTTVSQQPAAWCCRCWARTAFHRSRLSRIRKTHNSVSFSQPHPACVRLVGSQVAGVILTSTVKYATYKHLEPTYISILLSAALQMPARWWRSSTLSSTAALAWWPPAWATCRCCTGCWA